MIDSFGRILDNEHVDRFVMSNEDKLKSCHTLDDLIRMLNLNSAQFDSDSSSKDFSAKDLAASMQSDKDVITIFDGDKMRQVKKDFDAITAAKNDVESKNE